MRIYIPSAMILLSIFLIALIEYSAFLVGSYNTYTLLLGVLFYITIFAYDVAERERTILANDLNAYMMVVDIMKLDNRVERVQKGVKQHGNAQRRNKL